MIDVLLLAGRLVLALVLVVAALAKLADRDGARRSLEDFGAPARLAPAAAMGLPIAELLIAAGLIVSSTAPVAALDAAVLLGAFTLAVGLALVRGRETDCHCFGRLSSKPVGPGTLVRNLALLALAGFVAVAGHGDAGPNPPGWLLLVAGLTLNFVFLLQLFKQNGRLWAELADLREATAARKPGLAVGEPAPQFELADLAGAGVGLDDLLEDGRGAMLVFTDPKCGACDALLPELARRESDPEADPKPVLISHGTPDQVRAKLANHGVEKVLLAGDDWELPRSLGVTGTPGAVVIDRLGRVASEPVLGTGHVSSLLATTRPALVLVGEAG